MAQRARRERERSKRLPSQSTLVLAQISVPTQIPEFLAEQSIQTNVFGSSSLPTMLRENLPHNLYEGNFVEGTSVQSTPSSIDVPKVVPEQIVEINFTRSSSVVTMLQEMPTQNLGEGNLGEDTTAQMEPPTICSMESHMQIVEQTVINEMGSSFVMTMFQEMLNLDECSTMQAPSRWL
ncbi:unnamed protein product [Ilex paraguariensis]|uniref:Uncharacterized protein n=1 Tax=Ilex paraguariensis TaxID=185542 RepID=A0ABC8TZD7_9AQUA